MTFNALNLKPHLNKQVINFNTLKIMKTVSTLKKLVLIALVIGFSSCSSDDDNSAAPDPAPTPNPVQSELVENFPAPQTGGQGQPIGGPFTKFDFETGLETSSDTEWDIAFRGTTIAINGGTATGTTDEPNRNGDVGAAIVSGTTFANVTSADGLTFVQDANAAFAIPTGSDNGWYNYNFMTNVVSAIPGKVIVFRTRDGKYAKVEILSYYLNQDSSNPSNGRYYTFNYVYNPNDGDTSFE
jgi:hypothetical protein